MLSHGLGYQPGIWKLNCEQRTDATGDIEKRYYPIKFLGSYSSIIASTSTEDIGDNIYRYIRDKDKDNNNSKIQNIKKAYYTALARERYGKYSVNNSVNIIELIN